MSEGTPLSKDDFTAGVAPLVQSSEQANRIAADLLAIERARAVREVEAAKLAEVERLKKEEAKTAKFRELSKELITEVQTWSRWRDRPDGNVPWATVEASFRVTVNSMLSLEPPARVVALQRMLQDAQLPEMAFAGSAEEMAPGSAWMLAILDACNITVPHLALIVPPTASISLTQFYQRIKSVVEWRCAIASRAGGSTRMATVEAEVAAILAAQLPISDNEVAVRDALLAVGQPVVGGGGALVKLSTVVEKFKNTTLKARVTASKQAEAGKKYIEGAGVSLAVQVQAQVAQPTSVVHRVRKAIAQTWMRVAKPKGSSKAVNVVVDPASSVTLVAREFLDTMSGVVATTESAALDTLHVAGAEIALPSSQPVLLRLSESDKHQERLAEAFVIDRLPPGIEMVAGVDTLGETMGGCTIQIGSTGGTAVTFGTGPLLEHQRAMVTDAPVWEHRGSANGVEPSDFEYGDHEVLPLLQVPIKPRAKKGAVPAVADDVPAVAKNARWAKQATAAAARPVVPAQPTVVEFPDGPIDATMCMLVVLPSSHKHASYDETQLVEVRRGAQAQVDARTGVFSIAQDQVQFMQLVGTMVDRFVVEQHEAGIDVKGRDVDAVVRREGEKATVLLSMQKLDDEADYVPEMDVCPPPPPKGAQFKHKAGIDRFDELVDDVSTVLPGRGGMPESERARLKQTVRAMNLPLACKSAPPLNAQFIDHPDAVLHLRFKPDAKIEKINAKWRPMDRFRQDELNRQVAEWKRREVMVPIGQGDAQVISLPLVVPKRNAAGDTVGWRVAIDTRRLNEQLVQDRCAPAPRLHTVQRISTRADMVSSFDGSSLFTQFRVPQTQQRFLVVMTGPGQFHKLTGAPFGVSTMPGIAQQWMDVNLVGGDDDKVVYIDDVIITHAKGCSWKEAVDQVIQLLARAAMFNVALNVDKFQLFKDRPMVLGYEIDCASSSFKPNPPRLHVIASMQHPTNNKAMERALAMAAAHTNGLPGVNLIVQRLRAQCVKGQRLVHTEDGNRAWAELVAMMMSPAALKAHDETLQTDVWTDACETGIAWMITQVRDGKHWLVHAGGRRTMPFERRLSVPELEGLALRHAFDQAPHMLMHSWKGVRWFADSQTVVLARGQISEIKSRALRQFMVELLGGSFGQVEIVQVPGKKNLADVLSRQWQEDDLAIAMVTVALSRQWADEHKAAVVMTGVTNSEVPPGTPALEADSAEVLPELPASDDAIKSMRDSIAEALRSPEVVGDVEAEQRAWAHAQARERSPFMNSVRAAQTGNFVTRKSLRKHRVVADDFGRLYVVGAAGERRLVVPNSELPKLMMQLHVGLAHRKVSSMMAHFDTLFFNDDARVVAQQVVEACAACQQIDRKQRDGVIGFNPARYGRFETVSMDVFEIRDSGPWQYGLLVVDHATGVFEVMPMKARTAAAIEEALTNGYLTRWPTPRYWQSDNAQELVGEVMKNLSAQYAVAPIEIAAKNPRANGIVERQIGLFKNALRKAVPLGADWTKYVAKTRFELLSTISAARGGVSPMELATGVQPRLPGVAAAQWTDATTEELPADVAKKSAKAQAQWRLRQLRSKQAVLTSNAHEARAQRNAQAQRAEGRKAEVKPVGWQVGDVAWLEAPPKDETSKFNLRMLRTKIVVVVEVDRVRTRVRVQDWETRAVHKGWVPFRRVSLVKGSELEKIKNNVSTTVEHKPAEQPEVGKPMKAVPEGPAQKAPIVPIDSAKARATIGLEVMTDFGVIVNVTDTVNGRRVLLAEPNDTNDGPDWSKPLLEIDGRLLSKAVVQAAWRAKHLLRAPTQVKKAAAKKRARP